MLALLKADGVATHACDASLRGVIAFWRDGCGRGYGFIKVHNAGVRRLLVHESELLDAHLPRVGDLVDFSIADSPVDGRPMAVAVRNYGRTRSVVRA